MGSTKENVYLNTYHKLIDGSLVKYLKDFDVVNYHTLKSQHRDDDIMKILNYIEQKDKESKNNPK